VRHTIRSRRSLVHNKGSEMRKNWCNSR
jgi:hypothetical protein